MLAIPLDSETSTEISKLYGKAPFFALMDTQSGDFRVVENDELGKGPKIASFLKPLGVSSTIYLHMGEGVFQAFDSEDMQVFCVGKESKSLDEIYLGLGKDEFALVTAKNADTLLDPGESGSCKCGCE